MPAAVEHRSVTGPQVIAGLSLVLHESDDRGDAFLKAVVDAAREITLSLSHEDPWIVRGS